MDAKETIRKVMYSKNMSEITKIIEKYKDEHKSIQQENDANNKDNSKLKEFERKRDELINTGSIDDLNRIRSFEKQISDLKERIANFDSKTKDTLANDSKFSAELKQMIKTFFLNNNIKETISPEKFNELYLQINNETEFEYYRSRSKLKITLLKDLDVNFNSNVILKVLWKCEERTKYFAAPGPDWTYVKYVVEDDSGEMKLIIWNDQVEQLKNQ